MKRVVTFLLSIIIILAISSGLKNKKKLFCHSKTGFFLTGGRVAAIYRFGLLQSHSIFELLRFCSRTLIPPLILLYNVDFEKKSMKLSLCLKRPNKVVYLECFDEIQKWWIFMGGDESFWLYQMPDGGSREFATRCLRDSNNWKSLRPKTILNGIPFACFLWNS